MARIQGPQKRLRRESLRMRVGMVRLCVGISTAIRLTTTLGFHASLGTLDSAVGHVPTDGPVIIVTASYEGQPADNAAHFVEWLSTLEGKEFANVSYAVFGCGNHDWVATYQRIPNLCDTTIEARGGKRLLERGQGDAGTAEFFEVFETWEGSLWKALSEVSHRAWYTTNGQAYNPFPSSCTVPPSLPAPAPWALRFSH